LSEFQHSQQIFFFSAAFQLKYEKVTDLDWENGKGHYGYGHYGYFLPKTFEQKERGGERETERERERKTSTLSVQEFLAENNISLVFSSIFPSD